MELTTGSQPHASPPRPGSPRSVNHVPICSASHQIAARRLIWFTYGISTNSPGSSNAFEAPLAITYPAGRQTWISLKNQGSRSHFQRFFGSSYGEIMLRG